ncbi:MAG: hypothetical protein ACHQUA_01900, partial [Microgenomates group bacterium]
ASNARLIAESGKKPQIVQKEVSDFIIKEIERLKPTETFSGMKGLAQEARKYSSAEEFVKAQGTPIYRAGEPRAKPMSESTFFTPKKELTSEYNLSGKAKIYDNIVDESKLFKGESSQQYAIDNRLMNKPMSPDLQKLTGVKTLKQVEDIYVNGGAGGSKEFSRNPNIYYTAFQQTAAKDLKAKGFNGAKWSYEDDLTPTQYQIWDKSIIKTKSQLTDFYNKAVGKVGMLEDIASRARLVAESGKKPQVVQKEVSDFIIREVEDLQPMTRGTLGVGEDIIKETEIPKGLQRIERGFITSVKEELPDLAVKPLGKEVRVAGQYIPRSTDRLAIKARNLIQTDLSAAENLARTRSDDDAVAVGSELLKYYSDEALKSDNQIVRDALYDRAGDLANNMARKLTEQGRAVQAASILGRLTPEGQLKFAAREIQKFNELNPTRKIPELTSEQSKNIAVEMKEIQRMDDGIEKAMRFQ